MSEATKVVVWTVVGAALLALLIVANLALA